MNPLAKRLRQYAEVRCDCPYCRQITDCVVLCYARDYRSIMAKALEMAAEYGVDMQVKQELREAAGELKR